MLPGWDGVMTLPHGARLRALQDPGPPPARGGESGGTVVGRAGTTHVLPDGQSGRNARWEGRTAGEVEKAAGVGAFDALCDVVVADDLRTGLEPLSIDDTEENWRLRSELWT